MQLLLDRELETSPRRPKNSARVVMACREAGREGDDSSYAPGNIKRAIQNASRQFRIDRGQPSDLSPRDVIEAVQWLCLGPVGGCRWR